MIAAHGRLVLHALLLFAVGLFAAAPVVRFRMRRVAWPAMALLRAVMRLLGPTPSLAWMTAVIFCFNSAVMFLYMASGFHPLPPKVFGIWTGMNIAVILGFSHYGIEAVPSVWRRAGQWRPPEHMSFACGLLVLLLELPCFWLVVAMGMRMGTAVQDGVPYLEALAPRARLYASVVVPVLLVSALIESIAIRGSSPEVGRADGPGEGSTSGEGSLPG